MAEKKILLAAIKKGMKGEMDSVTMYEDAAAKTTDTEVKEFFRSRAEEEKLHYNTLLNYYKGIDNDEDTSEINEQVKRLERKETGAFTAEFKHRIAESQVLFSAISVAILLEKNAMDFYRKSSAEVEDAQLKDFFEMMAIWEEYHYNEVMEIMSEAEHHYWEINNFSPF